MAAEGSEGAVERGIHIASGVAEGGFLLQSIL